MSVLNSTFDHKFKLNFYFLMEEFQSFKGALSLCCTFVCRCFYARLILRYFYDGMFRERIFHLAFRECTGIERSVSTKQYHFVVRRQESLRIQSSLDYIYTSVANSLQEIIFVYVYDIVKL